MPTREEQFYETASRELAENKLSEAIWAKAFSLAVADEQKAKALYIKLRVEQLEKAFSLAVADEQKAKALYIKLRVEQLERERPRSAAEAIREAWPAIKSRQAFICPYCGAHTTALYDFFSISSRPHRYYCRACKKELYAEAPEAQTTAAIKGDNPFPSDMPIALAPEKNNPFPSDMPIALAPKVNNPWALWGFIIGLVSVFFSWIGIIPLIGLVLSVTGLTTFKPESQKNKWMAGVGLCLSIIYTLMYMREY